MEPLIQLSPGTNEHGLPGMLAGLVRQNLDDHPDKRRAFLRMSGRIAIVADDADASVTLHFSRGRLTVHDGIVGIPDVTVRAPFEYITKMSLMELTPRFGLPDPRGGVAREIALAAKEGRIRVHGLLPTNIPLILRLTRVMSVGG